MRQAQDTAARASLANAEAVQQAAEERLRNGLATLPDVLEARSATAQSQYDLQAVLGAEQIARGDLATALGAPAATTDSRRAAERSAHSRVDRGDRRAGDRSRSRPAARTSRLRWPASAWRRRSGRRRGLRTIPSLNFKANPTAQSLYMQQQTLPWGHTADLTGGVALSLNWTVFDGGARRSRLMQAEAEIRRAESQVSAARDSIEDEVWTAYSNLTTAFRQREAATALLESATQSYAAALESYNYGVRNLLDVTAAQKASRPGPLGRHPGADAGTNRTGRSGVPLRRLDPEPKRGNRTMSANRCRPFQSMATGRLAALFLTGCGRAPSFDVLGSFFPAWLACLASGRGAHGGRSMAPVAPSYCDRASSSDLSEPDGALCFRALARAISIRRKS